MAIQTQADMEQLAWNKNLMRKVKGAYVFVKAVDADNPVDIPETFFNAQGELDATWLEGFTSLGMTNEVPTRERESETDGGFTPVGSTVPVRDEVISVNDTLTVKTAEGSRRVVQEIIDGVAAEGSVIGSNGEVIRKPGSTPVWKNYTVVTVELDQTSDGLRFDISLEEEMEVSGIPTREDDERTVVHSIVFKKAAGSQTYLITGGTAWNKAAAAAGYTVTP